MRTARAAAILMPEERPSLHADGSSGCSGLTPPSPAPWRPLLPLDHTATSGVARHRGDAASAVPRPAVAADVRPPPACVSPASPTRESRLCAAGLRVSLPLFGRTTPLSSAALDAYRSHSEGVSQVLIIGAIALVFGNGSSTGSTRVQHPRLAGHGRRGFLRPRHVEGPRGL